MLAAQDFPPEHRRRKLYSGFRKNEARLPSRPQEPSERLPNCPCNLSAPFLPLPEFGLAYAAPQARYGGETGRFRLLQSHMRELQGKKPAEYIDWPWGHV